MSEKYKVIDSTVPTFVTITVVARSLVLDCIEYLLKLEKPHWRSFVDVLWFPVEAEIVFQERDYVKSSYRNYEEDNTVFCNVNVKLLW